jgi:hypothetical protein
MHARSVTTLIAVAGLAGLLAACSSYIQTTSGSDYLAAYAPDDTSHQALRQIDADITKAADVEPQLRFPARLGLARIENGMLTPIPPADAEQWLALAKRLGNGFGEFVPVSPLVVALAAPSDDMPDPWTCRQAPGTCLAEIVREVRLGAARQHLDAVLIYETFGKAKKTDNMIAFTKLALIGFFLPTEDIEAEGFANAVLVDVRNGYTYGTASAASEKPAYRLTSNVDSDVGVSEANADARVRAVASLTGEVETMLHNLREALQAKDATP